MTRTKIRTASAKARKTAAAVKRKKAVTPAHVLMQDPKHMLAWLKDKSPHAVVAKDMMLCGDCLGAIFLTESGHSNVTWGVSSGHVNHERINAHPVIVDAISSLSRPGAATVSQALRAIRRAQKDA